MGLEKAMEELLRPGQQRRSSEGCDFIIISDRGVDKPIKRTDPGAAGRRWRSTTT